ncbi:isochorismatase family protein [Streptococcus fryi]
MKALVILDCQNGMFSRGKFEILRKNILKLQRIFKSNGDIIISTKHIDNDKESIIYSGNVDGLLDEQLSKSSNFIIEKDSPNIFKSKELNDILSDYQVNEIVITGFNAEYCCLFSSIIASDRGYKVTYIEDATATVNNGDTYEMQDLDIIDFVGCILDWSGEVEVLYFDEFRKKINT